MLLIPPSVHVLVTVDLILSPIVLGFSRRTAITAVIMFPKMRPEPISRMKREDVIAHMAVGLLQAYRYFRAQRQVSPSAHTSFSVGG